MENKGLKYLAVNIAILVIVIIVYVIFHNKNDGARNITLSKDDNIKIASIVNAEEEKFKKEAERYGDTVKKIDSVRKIYLNSASDNIISYLNIAYSPESVSSENLKSILSGLTFQEIKSLTPGISLKIKSYFWLSDEKRYYEVLFWSLFGVLCSLLYFLSDFISKGQFKETELPVYIAKLFYAPLMAVAITFAYKNVIGTPAGIDDSSYGLLFISFVLGLFSARMYDVFNRIKEALIPPSDSPKPPPRYAVNGGVSGKDKGGKDIPDAEINKTVIKLINLNEHVEFKKSPSEKNYLFDNLKEGSYSTEAELIIGSDKYKYGPEKFDLKESKSVEVFLKE